MPDVASIDIQQEIQWFMRPYLIDFLVEAHAAFQLLPETLFLAVNLLDRYCSRRVVYKRHYQLVGCAALLIASKYGDRKERVPLIRELKSMCCNLYDEDMFTQMEWHVLSTLHWAIGHPTIDSWMQIILKSSVPDIEVEHMALFISEIALYKKDFVACRPSVMASASLSLARGILRRSETECQDHEEQITMINLSQLLHDPSQVLIRKYASPTMSRASCRLDDFLREQELLNRQQMMASAPPSPPCEVLKSIPNPNMLPGTPQKQGFGNIHVNGYATPPITPEGEYYVNGNEIKGYQAPRCPVTPTPQHPSSFNPYTQQMLQQPQYPTYHHEMTMQ